MASLPSRLPPDVGRLRPANLRRVMVARTFAETTGRRCAVQVVTSVVQFCAGRMKGSMPHWLSLCLIAKRLGFGHPRLVKADRVRPEKAEKSSLVGRRPAARPAPGAAAGTRDGNWAEGATVRSQEDQLERPRAM